MENNSSNEGRFLFNYDGLVKSPQCRHCEERSDAAISFYQLPTARLRSLSRAIIKRLLRLWLAMTVRDPSQRRPSRLITNNSTMPQSRNIFAQERLHVWTKKDRNALIAGVSVFCSFQRRRLINRNRDGCKGAPCFFKPFFVLFSDLLDRLITQDVRG
jgi:hypothetical protein